MRLLDELFDPSETTWGLLQEWMTSAKQDVRALPVDPAAGVEAVKALQVTTKSMLGTVAYYTGGILVDHGWLRLLGAGSEEMRRTLPAWNEGRLPRALFVADDVVGGFFAVNGGAFAGEVGDVFYLAPDSLEWESLEMPYSEFVKWALLGDVQRFYEAFRWREWRKQVRELHGDQGILIYPYLWAEGEDLELRDRKTVPIEELWYLTLENQARLGL